MNRLQRWMPRLVAGGFMLLVALAVVYFAHGVLDGQDKPQRPQVQRITLLPPPPPPPPKLEKPPEPPKVEEVKIEEPEPTPAATPDDAPPAEDLGLDADGSAGGDGFGLAARKGGRGLLGGDPLAIARKAVKDAVFAALAGERDLRRARFQITLRLWAGNDGRIARVELARSTGEAALDALIESRLHGLALFDGPPPSVVSMPVRVALSNG